jgi:hypothetical protein
MLEYTPPYIVVHNIGTLTLPWLLQVKLHNVQQVYESCAPQWHALDSPNAPVTWAWHET